jgi:hypothetical protein
MQRRGGVSHTLVLDDVEAPRESDWFTVRTSDWAVPVVTDGHAEALFRLPHDEVPVFVRPEGLEPLS